MLKALLKSLLRLNHNRKVFDEINNSDLFDESYYLSLYGPFSPYNSAIDHYIGEGAAKFYDPSPYFSTSYYLQTNGDLKKTKINPFYHYIAHGEQEGRCPNPYFNPEVYLQLNPDLVNWEGNLLNHYIQLGKSEGRGYCEQKDLSKASTGNTYQQWVSKNESVPFLEVTNSLVGFTLQPLISIVVPVYNPEKVLLIECIESVINQSYSNWELCLADDASPEGYVREVLEAYAAKDKRVKPIFREVNGHISAASNSAVEIAQGEWTALLDHDDLLHEHALYHVVSAINKKPDTEFIYSDEDKINEQGERIDPHFKSDWNLDLLYSQNYVSHLGVYKTAIVNKIGGFRLGYEGSQDYDLLLRYSREIDHDKIVHIPKVLYHWRMVEGSTALASGEKSYTSEAGIKA